MKTKPTGTPWSVADYTSYPRGNHVIRSVEKGFDDPHPVVASVTKRRGHKDNAYLMAAAPELRAALSAIVRGGVGNEKWYASAVAALAKADGVAK